MRIDPIAILRHGISSVLRNAGATLALSWPWLIVLAVVYSVLAYFVMQSGFGTTPLEPERGAGTFVVAMLIGSVFYIAGISSVAVNWHRFILLDRFPAVAERLRVDGVVWRYFGRALLSGLLVFGILIIPFVVLMMLLYPLLLPSIAGLEGAAVALAGGWQVAILLITFIMGTIATALFFRFALALPAVAVGRNEIGLFDSWNLTRGLYGSLLVIAGGTMALQLVTQLVQEGAAQAFGTGGFAGLAISVAMSVIVGWFFTFLGITLLTSLYGHIVESRPL